MFWSFQMERDSGFNTDLQFSGEEEKNNSETLKQPQKCYLLDSIWPTIKEQTSHSNQKTGTTARFIFNYHY